MFRPSPHGGAETCELVAILALIEDEHDRVRCVDRLPGRLRPRREGAQEAFAIAAERWARDGVPTNPGSWLVTTARNRAIDRIRRDRTLAAKARLLQAPEAATDEVEATTFPDERLELIFTCCIPRSPRKRRAPSPCGPSAA